MMEEVASMSPFATDPERERRRKDRGKRRYEMAQKRRESISRLVANPDFRMWFGHVADLLRGNEFGPCELSPFIQGKRSAFSTLARTLVTAEGGPEFLAACVNDFYGRVAAENLKAEKEYMEMST